MPKSNLHISKKIRKSANFYLPIFVLLAINLVIGAFIVSDYGESWDEQLRYQYAENSLNAYKGIPGDVKDEKGPFFVMVATLGANFICSLRTDCLVSDARHYINFLSFLLGLFFFYRLSCRFTNKWAALGATLLLNTQPLLWGHAFINPKDLPFMAFFIASVDTGFAMVDSFRLIQYTPEIEAPDIPKRTLATCFRQEWKRIPASKRRLITTFSIAIVILIFVLFAGQGLVQKGIEDLIQDLYKNEAPVYFQRYFRQVAQNFQDLPVENYLDKAWQLYVLIRKYISLALMLLWGCVMALALPETRNNFLVRKIFPFLKAIWKDFQNPRAVLAGVFLGLTSSIRTLGPAAGGLISLYLIGRLKKDAFHLLIVYWCIGALITYLTWPGLWSSPLQNYLQSLSTASDFPWDGKVLFRGIFYNVGTHPRSYLPVLLSIQLTLTALLTSVFGFVLSLVKIIKRNPDRLKITILILWFLIPFALTIIIEPIIYDNFRHLLFMVPPLFLFAAIGLQSLIERIKHPAIRATLILLIILPNIFSLVKLHPYQYVYYNALTNGVGGAFSSYEMDYWGTSYREATSYINQFAPSNARIIVYGAPHLVETYAREDLRIEKYKKDMQLDQTAPTFAILLSRYDKDVYLFPQAEIIYIIGRDGAIFTVIKQLN